MKRLLFISSALAASVLFGSAEIGSGEGWVVVSPADRCGITKGLDEIALTLADVLSEAVGAKVKKVGERQVPATAGRRIFIGERFAETAGMIPSDLKDLEHVVAEKDGDLYLFGRDRRGARIWDPRRSLLPSAMAAVKFMQNQVGVKFLMPGKVGREVPKCGKLVIPDGLFYRGTMRTEFQSGYNGRDLAFDVANNSYGTGRFYTYGGHTYPVACPSDKYFKTNPEYFGLKKGKRSLGSTKGCQAYCISNPGFQKLLYDEMLRQYDQGAHVCELGQQDGADVCDCEECRKMYDTGTNWREKLWLFHRDIALRIQKDRPGKVVQIISYWLTGGPPKTFKEFPDNVMIELCSYSEEALRGWDGYKVPQGFTYYTYNSGSYLVAGYTAKHSVGYYVDQIRRFHKYGMAGILRCGGSQVLYGTEGPAHYIYNRLVGDPGADVDKTLSEYYNAAFGPAADTMREFYAALDEGLLAFERQCAGPKVTDLVESTVKREKTNDPVAVVPSIYTQERLTRMENALSAAEKTGGLSDKNRRRLELVRTEFVYAKSLSGILAEYSKYIERPSLSAFKRMAPLIIERNSMVEKLFDEKGKIRKPEGWPELSLFGDPPKDQFQDGGRLSSSIKDPLTWDAATMLKYEIVSCVPMSPEGRAEEIRKEGLKPITGFRPLDTNRLGVVYAPYPDGTGFRLEPGVSNHEVRVTVRLGSRQGVGKRQGKNYRISWLSRWDNIKSDDGKSEGRGLCVSVGDRSVGNFVRVPYSLHGTGSSGGWVRECTLLKTPDIKDYMTRMTIQLWRTASGSAEFRDLLVEEVED